MYIYIYMYASPRKAHLFIGNMDVYVCRFNRSTN